MKIDGNALADEILIHLKNKIDKLHIAPSLAVILVGDNPASESYVRQKQKMADLIHAEVKVIRYPPTISQAVINKTIEQLNNDPSIHGIIIQRPLPTHLQNPELLNSIAPGKDIDGFVPGSKFQVPVGLAVEKILQKMYEKAFQKFDKKAFDLWVQSQNVTVIGRGETAGKPIAEYLKKKGYTVAIVHSKTPNEEKLNEVKTADIIISCVGKKDIITKDTIKQGAMLISVGIWRDNEGKLHGDYEEEDIDQIASLYTPTPGGVGPVNVACLMENLVSAAS